ncbi:hypothetical protein DL93DRAFT_587878 [Clavulina sp. PMI_390]|nr:hypothetical protein DL93DRAFT_587878 [Clavulina sp. PMI_390]
MLLPGGRYVIGIASTWNDGTYLALWDLSSSRELQPTSHMDESALELPPMAVKHFDAEPVHTPSTNFLQAQWDEVERRVTIMVHSSLAPDQYECVIYQIAPQEFQPTFSQRASRVTFTESAFSLFLGGDIVSMSTRDDLILWNWRENTCGRLRKPTIWPESDQLRGQCIPAGNTLLHTAYGEDAHLVVVSLPELPPVAENSPTEILPQRVGSIKNAFCTKPRYDYSRLFCSDPWIPHSPSRSMQWLWTSSSMQFHVVITSPLTSPNNPSTPSHASNDTVYEHELLVAKRAITLFPDAEDSISIDRGRWPVGDWTMHFQRSWGAPASELSGHLILTSRTPATPQYNDQPFISVVPTQEGSPIKRTPRTFGAGRDPHTRRFRISLPIEGRHWKVVGVCPISGTFLLVNGLSRVFLGHFD